MTSPRAVIISGAGRYADPWHPFEQTSAALARLLTENGVTAHIYPSDAGDVDLAGVDLLVVNAGGGSTTDADDAASDPVALRRSVLDFTAAGGPTLVVHTGSNTFYESARWSELLGGAWVTGVSMHPPLAEDVVQVVDADHPISTGLGELRIRDERYSFLRVAPTARVLITHRHDDTEHALVWVHTHEGVRVVYDALGHDEAAYAGADRRELLRREVAWLLDRTTG
ncbi:ThuA domain-containing protein [Pseudactinotalea sp. Z1748]|uniref:ThuA domain-containing protein n=1 Tax=Pseudactinotalea sp. Z1748 TaxID=3413027 RepID=UPI003C7AFAF9